MIVEAIVIGVFILIAFYYIKMEHHARKLKVVAAILIILLLYFSVSGVLNSNQVDITSPSGIVNAVYLYVGWIGHTAVNLWNVGVETVNMVGNAVKVGGGEDDEDEE